MTWEIYSGGKQPYPAINNTEVVQKVGVICVKHIDEASSNDQTVREFVMINKAVAVSIFNRSSMVTDLKNLKGAQMICTGW